MIGVMLRPLIACLILTGIHTYLGIHVISREVIFVDLALAQIAALGAAFAFLLGYSLQSQTAAIISLAFTLLGAAIFSLTRPRHRGISQEAIIGIVYAVSAATFILVIDRAPQGAEHIKEMLVGSILTVTDSQIIKTFLLYAGIGLFHWFFRRKFLLISFSPEEVVARGLRVRLWDFLFYASFGVVVTIAVQMAGVLLVFAFLIVPAFVSTLFAHSLSRRLAIGWALGFVGSILGLFLSYILDMPTGAAVVATFGGLLILSSLARLFISRFQAVPAIKDAGRGQGTPPYPKDG